MAIEKIRKMVSVDSLKDAPHNPPNRITEAALKPLCDSLETLGQLQPITIGLDDVIIEGHRRRAAARLLGWQLIEANIVKDVDVDAIYGSVNSTMRKLSGSDSLFVWLANPKAVVPSARKNFEAMVKVLGRPLVKQICNAGFSRRCYLTACKIARYCESDTPETIRQITEWLLEFPVSGQVMKAIESGASPKIILQAVRAKKAVSLQLGIK